MAHLHRNLRRFRQQPKPRYTSNMDCSPTEWREYFTKKEDVKIGNNTFRAYLHGTTGPLLVLLHGGGYSALTWAVFTKNIVTRVECQVVAIDLRGHGSTVTDDESDLSLETLANDVYQVIIAMYTENYPQCIIIGHSMGGAVAVEAVKMMNGTVGLCVIDVVEGTALEALSSMQSILRGRPVHFRTVEQAIQWSLKGGQTHNLEAAKVSMPGQIKNVITGQLASEELEAGKLAGTSTAFEATAENFDEVAKILESIESTDSIDYPRAADTIREEEEDNLSMKTNFELPPPGTVSSTTSLQSTAASSCTSLFKNPSSTDLFQYIWRIDLSKTERFWGGWFNGLSQKFLDLRPPKILLLANIQGLDTTLTVGQMQGKFQMQVLARSGHAIHEDQPEKVADILAGFMVKQKLAVAKDGFTPPLPGC